MATLGGVTVPGSGTAASTGAPPASVGGTPSGSLFNMGSTSAALQQAAITGIESQQMKDTVLATNYAQSPALVSSGIAVADWYRLGKPGTTEGQLYDRHPKRLDPPGHEEELAAIRVFGTVPESPNGDVELVPAYTKFILEGMTEGHAERTQIVETFGDFYVFFFGERPPMYSYTGTLINARDINWRADFQFYYDNYLRGTKCVERNARIVMTYGGRQVEGFLMNFQTTTSSELEAGVKVSFQLIITKRLATLGLSKDFGVFTQNGQQFTDETFTALLEDIAGKEGKGLSAAATSVAYAETQQALAGGNSTGPLVSDLPGSGSLFSNVA